MRSARFLSGFFHLCKGCAHQSWGLWSVLLIQNRWHKRSVASFRYRLRNCQALCLCVRNVLSERTQFFGASSQRAWVRSSGRICVYSSWISLPNWDLEGRWPLHYSLLRLRTSEHWEFRLHLIRSYIAWFRRATAGAWCVRVPVW